MNRADQPGGSEPVIDVHCHILPELDDGARSLADSVGMARQAHADGIEAVCATPHIRHDHRVIIDEIADRVAAVQRELERLEIPVRVLPGGELAETEADAINDEQLRRVTLGATGAWVLLEPGPGPIGAHLVSVADRLCERGVGAVIAHPERHAGRDFVERLRKLTTHGCLIQWTAEFVGAAQPGDLVLRLARAGLVHVLGSDAHSSLAGRPLRMAAAYDRLRTAVTSEQLRWISEITPRAVVNGVPLTTPAPRV